MWMRLIILFSALLLCSPLVGQDHSVIQMIENKGQWPEQVVAGSDLKSGKIFFEKGGFTFHFYDLKNIRVAHDNGQIFTPNSTRIKGHVYKVNFLDCNESISARLEERQKTYYNYFLGNDQQYWAGGCGAYGKITQQNLYEGIDLVNYSLDGFLKYDFVVHAGADPNNIKMSYDGIEKIQLENDRIKLTTSVNEVWEQKPVAWQIIAGEKRLVACKYVLMGNVVHFEFPKGYDKKHELIIDPQLVFSSYSGSSSDNFGYTATYDTEGFLYSGSSAFGQNYPVTIGAYQTTHHGGNSPIEQGIDMALSKYDISGTFMVWSTFLGGAGDDLPHSIITNSNNELMVYGSTGSNDFPITTGAIQTSFGGGSLVSPSGTGANFPNGSDIVVAHFNAFCTGLLGSTYLGGSGNDGVCTSTALKHNYADEFRGEISLDENENILIVSSTFSVNFPVMNAYQSLNAGSQDAVLMKLNPTLTTMLWGTYLGGTSDDSGFSITNNSLGELYVCGGTNSDNFPTTINTVQQAFGTGLADGYIAKFSVNGQSLLASTFWGSNSYDQLYFIEIDNEDLVYVFGQTTAAGSSMIINAGYGTPDSGNLLSKFNANLTQVIWSTVFGTGNSKPNLSPSAFLVDYCNRIYISGWGITTVNNNPLNPGANLHSMNNLETTPDAFDNTCSTGDFYMAVFDENITQLEYGTFFGGGSSSEHVDGGTSRFDRKGVIYQSVCAGCGGFDDFPIFPSNAWSAVNNSSCNNGVYKFDFQLPITIADFNVSPTSCVNSTVQFTNSSTYASSYEWHFGDSGTSNLPSPQHTYITAGTFTIMLVVTHNTTCNGVDTVYKEITILEPVNATLNDVVICSEQSTTLGFPNANPTYSYSWSPINFLNNPNISNPVFQNGADTDYTLTVQHDGCIDTYLQSVDVTVLNLLIPGDTTLCDDVPLTLIATYSPLNAAITWSNVANFSNMLNDNTSDPDIVVNVVVPTTYYVRIQVNNCTMTAQVFVNLVSFQTVIQGDFTTCINDTIELSVLAPNPNFTFAWIPENLIVSGQNTPSILAVVNEETVFTVLSTTADNCTASDSVTVTVSDLTSSSLSATANPMVIVQGQSSQLSVQPSGLNYTWSPPTALNNIHLQYPVATPSQDITYTVTAMDGECAASAQIFLRVVDFVCGPPSIYVPNAFTPNQDGTNEKFFVRGNNITKLYFVIYDRWGEKMFETTKLESGWDGKYNGRDLDPDVYVYYLEATCAGGLDYFEEGNITLIR